MQFIGLPSLILGIIFMTAGSHWFHGAPTVGLILTIVSAVVLLFGIIVFAVVATAMSKAGNVTYRRRRRF